MGPLFLLGLFKVDLIFDNMHIAFKSYMPISVCNGYVAIKRQ